MKNITTCSKVIMTICFVSLNHILLSQENQLKHVGGNQRSATNQNTSENAAIVKTRVSNNTKTSSISNGQKSVDTQGKSFQLDENDYYQGRKEEFLSQIILKELPMDFPKYEKWMGVRHYNEAIDDYYKKHLEILNPSVKQKLTQSH